MQKINSGSMDHAVEEPFGAVPDSEFFKNRRFLTVKMWLDGPSRGGPKRSFDKFVLSSSGMATSWGFQLVRSGGRGLNDVPPSGLEGCSN